MKTQNLMSADVQIGEHPGFAVIEYYENKASVVVERYYPTLSDLEVDVAVGQGLEEIINTYPDWGNYYDSIPKKEGMRK